VTDLGRVGLVDFRHMPARVIALYESMCLKPAHEASRTLFAMPVLPSFDALTSPTTTI
jgi:hypothetical protein